MIIKKVDPCSAIPHHPTPPPFHPISIPPPSPVLPTNADLAVLNRSPRIGIFSDVDEGWEAAFSGILVSTLEPAKAVAHL